MAPRVGLLGLYLELYDRAMPDVRPRVEGFYQAIAGELERRGVEVLAAPVCRLQAEVAAAVQAFERGGAQAIVTLHLAYSPSLEAADALAATRLPVVMLDTTPAADYGPGQDPAELMYNHGIHGVQDLANVLLRRGKAFEVEAGHWQGSDVLDRVAGWAAAAQVAAALRTARVGLVGEPFAGMGDFAVPPAELRASLGVEVVTPRPGELAALAPAADHPAVEREWAADQAAFEVAVSRQDCLPSLQAGLAVRRWMAGEGLTAFTVNFLQVNRACGLPTVPFLEAGQAMARGQGYAGEGDVLTAALVGALAGRWPTTFTEMFCPDWAGERVFLSHMGEVNVALLAGRGRLLQKPFPWTDVPPPVVPVGLLRGGPAALVNLAPARHGYRLLAAAVTMEEPAGEDRMADSVHGWLRPGPPVADFLADYSRAGGTHHCALAYGAAVAEIGRVGRLLGWEVVTLGAA